MAKRKIEVIASSSQYFEELTLEAAQKCSASTDSQALSYIASLLNKVVKSSLNDLQPLFVKQFVEVLSKPAGEQLRICKTTGDLSLIISGVFSDSINKKLLDLEYYVSIGKTSYENASRLSHSEYSSHVFGELSVGFNHYLEVLHRVSLAMGLLDTTNVLNIYETWLQTQSPHLRKLLATHGITFQKKGSNKTKH